MAALLGGDPVTLGLVSSLAKPGGNITGFKNFEYTLGGKWLELLREIAPGVARVAVIQKFRDQASSQYTHAIRAAAQSLGVPVTADDAQNVSEIERTVVKLAGRSYVNQMFQVVQSVVDVQQPQRVTALMPAPALELVYAVVCVLISRAAAALLAVQIIATGFAGLRFLRQSHRQTTEDYINAYAGRHRTTAQIWPEPVGVGYEPIGIQA